MKRVVAFDFDGTYTLHDSLPEFLKQSFGKWSYLWGLLVTLPWLVLFKLRLLRGGQAKERLIGHFVKGMPREQFEELGRKFKSNQSRLTRPEAERAMNAALNAGDEVLVVTASIIDWVKPWFEGKNVKILATEMEVDKDGRLTGRFATPNCNGAEKWRRITAAVPDVEQHGLTAYGDSGGDSVMLSHADKAYLRDFDMTMDQLPYTRRHPGRLFWLVLLALVLYQLLGVFFGMDIADAGFYLTFYDNIFTHPDSVEYNFMYYLSGVIGGAFQSLFPSMGMCGMRLLGVAFNTLCAVILYYVLRRHVDERALTLGCALVVTSFIAPPYTLCYDLCTIVFYVLAITLLWRGLEKDRTWMVGLAGVMAGLNILVRIPNVLGLLMALIPLIRYFAERRRLHISWKRPLLHTLAFLVSAALAVGMVLALMPEIHNTCLLNVLRDLRAIAADQTGTASHTTGQMMMVQLKFYATELWTAVKLAVPVAIYWWVHNQKSLPQWTVWAAKVVALAVFVWLVMRMHPLQPLWVMCMAGGIMVIIEQWKQRSGLVWMAVLGIGMMLVMPLGSDGAYNNGTIITWALAPVAALWWLRRSRIAFPLVFIAVCAVRMVTGGAYFDGGALWHKHYTVDNPRAAHIYTTRERAELLNTVLHGIAPHVKPGTVLMAYGSAPLMNYLTHTRPYMGCSWVEQLSVPMLEKKLAYAPKAGFPLVLQQKFNPLGPFWSEPTEDFRTDYGQQDTYRDNRKLEVLNEFLKRGDYHVIYEDSHFILYQPGWGEIM